VLPARSTGRGGVDSLSEDDVAAAVRGEPQALHKIYRELAPAVLGFLRVRGSEDPEGLMQDVFVAVLPRLCRLEGGLSGLRTLAFSVAHARLVDEFRRRGRRPRVTAYEPTLDSRSAPSPEQEVLSKIDLARLVRLLAEVDENMRLAVTLRIVGQLSLEETAAVMGKSVGAIKQLQRRGLQALRSRLEAEDAVTSAPDPTITDTAITDTTITDTAITDTAITDTTPIRTSRRVGVAWRRAMP
jgi:RNA polymerase sigma-70 factor (ECF subfamily)